MKDIIPGLTQKHKSIRALSQVPSKPTAGLLPENQVHPAKVKNGEQHEEVCMKKKNSFMSLQPVKSALQDLGKDSTVIQRQLHVHNFLTHSSPVSKFGMYITHNPFDESGVLHM